MRMGRGTTPRRALVGAGGLRGGSVTPHVPDPPRRLPAPPVTAVEAPTHLVAGDCTTHPDADTC